MAANKTDVYVYADWLTFKEPKLVGTLSAHEAKGKRIFSFEYYADWLATEKPHFFDTEISWNKGQQFPKAKNNFGVFNDSMPDTWGRTLMKRRESILAKEEGRIIKKLGRNET